MGRFFTYFIVLGAVFLGACNRSEITPVDVPKDVAAVADPFLAAVKANDLATANKYVDRYALDETLQQFQPAQADLEASPKLTPVAVSPKRVPFGVDENEMTVVYLAKKGNNWTTAKVRLGRAEGEKFEVEQWSVTFGPDKPEFLKRGEEMRWFIGGIMGAMGVGALFVLALILWFVRRKAHLAGPQPLPEKRESAVTTRDPEA